MFSQYLKSYIIETLFSNIVEMSFLNVITIFFKTIMQNYLKLNEALQIKIPSYLARHHLDYEKV